MQLGYFSIYLALSATLLSAYFYFRAIQNQSSAQRKKKQSGPESDKFRRLGRQLFYLMVALVVLASLYLWYLIFTHQFQVSYIYRYTSRDLGLGYLISAFWAGQEGSFLFWTLMIALMGLFFMRSARQYETWAMFFLNLVQAGFFVLLIKANPFLTSAQIPPDGAGLNPLLQNFWMVIHPPILFLGYAAVTLPFVIALSALMRRDFEQWIKVAFPWTLFASVTLGAGIIIGGFWAYEVLGWGGYWGWDPVENSSLIAWLAVLAMFHSMIISRRNGALQKTTLSLAVFSFVLVLYATYLTRSGVLADFSVHSFQNLGLNTFMIIFQLAALGLGILLIFLRRGNMKSAPIGFKALTKENALLITVILLAASAFLTLIGTSSPILSGLAGNPSQVDIGFYNTVNLPLAVLMSVLLGIAPFLIWRNEKLKVILKRLLISSLAAVVAFALGLWLDLPGFQMNLLLALAVFALSSNLIVGWQKTRTGWKNSAASLSHVGLGLMFIGIVISGSFTQEKRVMLVQGQQTEALGVKITYRQDFSGADGKQGLLLDVQDGDDFYQARPRLYQNNYTQSEMREPHVRSSLLSDLYISPLQKQRLRADISGDQLHLKKGERKNFAGYEVEFLDFDMTGQHSEKGMRIAAKLLLSKNGTKHKATPALLFDQGRSKSLPADLQLENPGQVRIILERINADQKTIQLRMQGFGADGKAAQVQQPQAQLLVDVSRKPFMNVLWLGTILLTLGTLIAVKKRADELKTE